MAFAFSLAPDSSQTDPTIGTTATIITPTNIAGSGTIIDIITIAIMIGTTTGINASRFHRPIKDLLEGTL
jgi:Na+/H+-dicarboxylate symporter